MANSFLTVVFGSALLLAAGPLAAEAPATPADLPAEEYHQLRCTMLAGAVLYDFDRGATDSAHGIDEEKMEQLGEALNSRLADAYGSSAEETRALLKADFEAFAAEAAEAGPGWADEQVARCQPLWDTPPLPAAPLYDGAPIDAVFCHAVADGFATAMAGQAGEDNPVAAMFAAQAQRLEQSALAGAGEDEAARAAVRERLAQGAAAFDPAAWDALDETEAESIMQWCERAAGPAE